MTVIIDTIKTAIARIEKRIAEIQNTIGATPLSDIIKLRRKFGEYIDSKNRRNLDCAYLKKMSDKEKELFKIAKIQQEKSSDLITEQVNLESELCDLKNDLYKRTNKNRGWG